ncbi:MAG TPA: M23 family metallopeptidase [Pyrinomonadaceae bacterium]|nr:M23 family metallopeptidase [Pyrinomonadaceae bacterium]
MRLFLLAVVAFLFPSPAGAESVRVTVRPQQVYVERASSGQLLNFDFLLENLTPDKLRLTAIRVRVLDRAGRLVLKRSLDAHGLSPAIETVPKTEIAGRGSLYLFNPFHTFDGALDIKTLKYEFHFAADAGPILKSEAAVEPIEYRTKTSLILPLKGRVVAENGHDFYSPHRRIDLTHPLAQMVGLKANSARYADDLTIAGEDGELHRGDGNRLEDWFGYGATLYAPGAGKVVALVDEVPDNTLEAGKVVFSKTLSPDKASGIFGNFIVIDHGNGEYSLFAHLLRGSFLVKPGETVKQGQPLARVGFSGNTDFVHTHYQLQNNADAATAEGVPAYFRDFRRVLGSKTVEVKIGPLEAGIIMERR